jgi:hypothetical protein
VTSFAFSRDGSALAFVAGEPGRPGDLWLARGGGAAERLGRGVAEFRFARSSSALAWLEAWDPGARSGRLAALAPGGQRRALGERVSAFEVAPDGSALAWLAHVVAGGYSVDLWRAALGGGEPAQVARGVFGFDFGPGGALWYRTACRRSAEACDLYSAPAAGGAPLRLAEGMKSFELDPRRPGRALLGWSRKDRVALDLAVWEEGKLTPVDRSALPGSAFLLAPDSARMAYVVNDPRRAGVYLADLPGRAAGGDAEGRGALLRLGPQLGGPPGSSQRRLVMGAAARAAGPDGRRQVGVAALLQAPLGSAEGALLAPLAARSLGHGSLLHPAHGTCD